MSWENVSESRDTRTVKACCAVTEGFEIYSDSVPFEPAECAAEEGREDREEVFRSMRTIDTAQFTLTRRRLVLPS